MSIRADLRQLEGAGHLVLCTPNGELLNPALVLEETGYVHHALNDLANIPILCLCTAVEDSKPQRHRRQDSAANKDEIERLVC